MAGEAPGRAATRAGVVQKQTRVILRHREPCANCSAPLTGREFRYCRSCKAWLAIYARTCEIARLFQASHP